MCQSVVVAQSDERPAVSQVGRWVAQSLEQQRPVEELLLEPHAAEVVKLSAGENLERATTAHVRLWMWLGDARGIAPIKLLAERKSVDRFAAVRALVALDAPEAEKAALELFEDEPQWGAPLVASYHGTHGNDTARRLLFGDEARHWQAAMWVLGNCRDYQAMNALEERARSLPPLGKVHFNLLYTALRRLRIEQRDVRPEALWEYLEELKPQDLEERLWCLVELAHCHDQAAVSRLQLAPWKERSNGHTTEAAVILWARHFGGDRLKPDELHHLRLLRWRLSFIPGASRWPPRTGQD